MIWRYCSLFFSLRFHYGSNSRALSSRILEVYYTFQDIQEAHAGEIVAVFGIDCASGTVDNAVLVPYF